MKWFSGIIAGIIVGVVVYYLTVGMQKPPTQMFEQPQTHLPPAVSWQKQDSYNGNCRARPAGTVCAGYEDGFVWLVRSAISGWEKRVESNKRIQVAITNTGRYEHILGTNYVRVVH